MATISENADTFCRMVEARSREHHQAMQVALGNGWLAIAGSVLRMELDSMIRVIYLRQTPNARERILASCIAGEGFKDGQTRIPDRAMVEVATRVNGWVRAVYDFGNMFVHLTNMHDYAAVDPFQVYECRGDVLGFLNHYHRGKAASGPLGDNATLRDVAAYAPHVLDKITSNLVGYAEDLRAQVSR
ncbi:hypothetical protein [Micromonospora sp. NPDC126480]|uniref:hypothetical protein n=1 Tax=Micromonospora sp. NPDC126480 TaxID=3155312 RepID=UPI003327BE9A